MVIARKYPCFAEYSNEQDNTRAIGEAAATEAASEAEPRKIEALPGMAARHPRQFRASSVPVLHGT